MATTLGRVPLSIPVSTYAYKTGALAAGLNSLVLIDISPGFTPNPDNFYIFPRTTSAGGGTPSPVSISFDVASLVVDPTNYSQVLVDVYATSDVSDAIIFMS